MKKTSKRLQPLPPRWLLTAVVLLAEVGTAMQPRYQHWACWTVYVWPVLAWWLGFTGIGLLRALQAHERGRSDG